MHMIACKYVRFLWEPDFFFCPEAGLKAYLRSGENASGSRWKFCEQIRKSSKSLSIRCRIQNICVILILSEIGTMESIT